MVELKTVAVRVESTNCSKPTEASSIRIKRAIEEVMQPKSTTIKLSSSCTLFTPDSANVNY